MFFGVELFEAVIDRERMRPEEALLHRVKRRGADIPVYDSDRTQHQLGKRFLGAVVNRNIVRGNVGV